MKHFPGLPPHLSEDERIEQDQRCPKCDYELGVSSKAVCVKWKTAWLNDELVEFLEVACGRCGFGWREACADVPTAAALTYPALAGLFVANLREAETAVRDARPRSDTSWQALQVSASVEGQVEPPVTKSMTPEEEIAAELDDITTALNPDPMDESATVPVVQANGKLAWVMRANGWRP